MSISEQVSSLATRIGQECYTLHGICGVLTDLSTTEKSSLVAAVNELKGSIGSVTERVAANEKDIASIKEQLAAGSTYVDDTQESTVATYSSSKIASEITAAKQSVKDDILGGAGEAYDTLKELADLIGDNKDAIDALETIASKHVRYDQEQTLTDEQKAQARTNIGAASAADLTSTNTNLGNLTTAVGDTDTNFVTVFETALAGSTEDK
jgi:hypothetical protein